MDTAGHKVNGLSPSSVVHKAVAYSQRCPLISSKMFVEKECVEISVLSIIYSHLMPYGGYYADLDYLKVW